VPSAASVSVPPSADLARSTSVRRLVSLDAFRGATMLFMASEILRIERVARGFPDSPFARFTASMLEHREWIGCSPWDLIQPAFMFIVGVALPFSLARREARGDPFGRMLAHSIYRALVLILLGIFLRSQSRAQTNFTFEDVLTQIGLAYVFLFLLARTRMRAQWTAAALILAGYWAAFALYPVPPPGFDTAAVGVPPDWPHHLTGFWTHWDKNTNAAAAFDRWFLNLFPRESPFVFNRGGYSTLNFVPSLATMIFGLIAGGVLFGGRSDADKTRRLALWGVAFVLLGAALHVGGVCPIVKRIWTPAWAIFSAGWVLLMLAALFYVVDVRGHRRWTFPFLVIGMNSIAMYVLVHIADGYIARSLKIHLGSGVFDSFGTAFEPLATGAATLFVLWLILLWMYTRKLFIRI